MSQRRGLSRLPIAKPHKRLPQDEYRDKTGGRVVRVRASAPLPKQRASGEPAFGWQRGGTVAPKNDIGDHSERYVLMQRGPRANTRTEPTMTPLSVQLYSLREAADEDLGRVLERLAAIGYQGVEPFALHGMTPEAFKARVEDLGMAVSSSHHPWANRAATSEVVDTVGALGLTRACGGFEPEDFKDMDAVKRTADTVNAIIDALAPHGIDLFLHNHWWEFLPVGDRLGFEHIAERCPRVLFEIDTYWAANFGAVDAPAQIRRVKDRVPLLHVKDGPLIKGMAHVAAGDGKMDIRGVLGAADPNVLEWAIVELDACDSDMMTAVERSYRYLTRHGLAAGRV